MMNITAIKVNVVPKINIGAIKFNERIMVWQNLIGQYCYLPGFQLQVIYKPSFFINSFKSNWQVVKYVKQNETIFY